MSCVDKGIKTHEPHSHFEDELFYMVEGTSVVHLNGAENQYTTAAVYAVYGDSSKIQLLDGAAVIEGNAVKVTLPAYCAAMVVLHTAE